MYGKLSTGVGLVGSALPLTGINILFSLLMAFVLIGVGFALARCLPKRHTC